MYFVRTLRMSSAAVAAVLLIGTVGAAPAMAGKPSPAPTGVAATVDAHANGSYDVAASWNAVPNATSYKVALAKGGTTLASATVTATHWAPTFTTSPGTATLSVRGLVGKKPGRIATLSVVLDDVTAPKGSYSSTWNNNNGDATITQDSLTDNAPVSGVSRTVDWNDGSDPVAWTSGTTINHTYPLTEKRYVPTVTLEDAAHNVRVVDAPAIVINDDEAPTGAFANQTATAWSAFTSVTVAQQGSLADNWSPADHIARSVDWGDGTTTDWTSGATVSHVYATAGSYTPAVTITDEAHNPAAIQTSAVVVTADTVGPRVKLTLPKARHSVKAWRTLRGKATDAQTGVKGVWLKAVEKRGGSWFGYNASTHHWVKAGSKTKAFSRGKAFRLTTNARHRWSAKLVKLRRGTLVYKVRATDHVMNRSATVNHTARLTKA